VSDRRALLGISGLCALLAALVSSAQVTDGAQFMNGARDPGPAVMRWLGAVALLAGCVALALGRRRYSRRAHGGFLPLTLIPTLIFLGGSLTYHLSTATEQPATPGRLVVDTTSNVASAVADGVAPISSGGHLLYALKGFIWQVNPAGGEPVNLTPNLEIGTYATSPALAPDGVTLAFVLARLPSTTSAAPTSTGLITELYSMRLGERTTRRLLSPAQPDATLADPMWADDGKSLLFTVNLPLTDGGQQAPGALTTLQRLDLATGNVTTVAVNAAEPSVCASQTGEFIAYVAPGAFGAASQLVLVDARTQQRRVLVGVDLGFLAIHRPRCAPDGQAIVFTAVGDPQPTGAADATQPLAFRTLLQGLAHLVLPDAASAHGQTQELWLVRTDGSALRRLTRINADDPSPAWSPDGRQIAFLVRYGLYVLDVDDHQLFSVANVGASSSLIWKAP
jgi:Tol biopolymer transport system component